MQRGDLPHGSEFDKFRDVLERRRQGALVWVGRPSVACPASTSTMSYARWATSADILWGVIRAEGLLTRTRRRKSL